MIVNFRKYFSKVQLVVLYCTRTCTFVRKYHTSGSTVVQLQYFQSTKVLSKYLRTFVLSYEGIMKVRKYTLLQRTRSIKTLYSEQGYEYCTKVVSTLQQLVRYSSSQLLSKVPSKVAIYCIARLQLVQLQATVDSQIPSKIDTFVLSYFPSKVLSYFRK